MSSPVVLYCPLAASIKAVVRVPMIAVGRINDPAVAERVLAKVQFDVALTDAEVDAFTAFLGSLIGPVLEAKSRGPVLLPAGFNDPPPRGPTRRRLTGHSPGTTHIRLCAHRSDDTEANWER